jgi:homocysteine S-methyltransferase
VLWTSKLNFTHPEPVQGVHEAYAAAGADIITTNTFRTNYSAWKQAGSPGLYASFVHAGVLPAQKAREKYPNVIVAGSNAPAEDCYKVSRELERGELYENHELHCNALLEAGVDFLLHETQSHLDEIEIICKICDNLEAPYGLSLYLTESLHLLSGEPVELVLEQLSGFSIDVICFNCLSLSVFEKLLSRIDLPPRWGFYLNCGTGVFSEGKITGCLSPEAYCRTVAKGLVYKPSIVGGCCGTTADHIAKIRSMLDAQSIHEITG